MAACYHCSAKLDGLLAIGSSGASLARDTECPACKRDVRVCKNCRHYSPGSRWDCAESVEDPIYDKEKGNFCGHFTLGSKLAEKRGQNASGSAGSVGSVGSVSPAGSAPSDAAKKAFLDLFGSGDDDIDGN